MTQLGEDACTLKSVSLWNLELLFEIACCPTRLVCTPLLSQQHLPSLRAEDDLGQDVPVQKLAKEKGMAIKDHSNI